MASKGFKEWAPRNPNVKIIKIHKKGRFIYTLEPNAGGSNINGLFCSIQINHKKSNPVSQPKDFATHPLYTTGSLVYMAS